MTARPTDAPDERTTTFVVLERFHLAIAIVTVGGSAVFLLALMVMLVDERRGAVGMLRLIGLPARRILMQVLLEGPLIASSGAVFGLVLASIGGPVQPLLPVALRHRAHLSFGSPLRVRRSAVALRCRSARGQVTHPGRLLRRSGLRLARR